LPHVTTFDEIKPVETVDEKIKTGMIQIRHSGFAAELSYSILETLAYFVNATFKCRKKLYG